MDNNDSIPFSKWGEIFPGENERVVLSLGWIFSPEAKTLTVSLKGAITGFTVHPVIASINRCIDGSGPTRLILDLLWVTSFPRNVRLTGEHIHFPPRMRGVVVTGGEEKRKLFELLTTDPDVRSLKKDALQFVKDLSEALVKAQSM